MKNLEEALHQLAGKNESLVDEIEALPHESDTLTEDYEGTLPAHPLSENEILDFLGSVPKAGPGVPPPHFKLGYICQVDPRAEFKDGGRGHVDKVTGEVKPVVKIVKVAEYANCYCERYADAKATQKALAAQGRTVDDIGARKGFHPAANGMRAVFESDSGKGLAFGALIDKNVVPKVRYFVSLNNSDLVETSKADVAQYMGSTFMKPYEAPDDGQPQRTQTFLFSGIYLIGTKGSSIL